MQSDTTVVSIAAVFFKKTAIIMAIHGQKKITLTVKQSYKGIFVSETDKYIVTFFFDGKGF